MTQDEIIRMALEAGFEPRREMGVWGGSMHELKNSELNKLKRFAALVAAHEREACAKVCEEMYDLHEEDWDYCVGLVDCAAAIRARGEK